MKLRRFSGMVNFKSGEAAKGVISMRPIFSRFVHVRDTTMITPDGVNSAKADGIVMIPKSNILFVQEFVSVVPA